MILHREVLDNIELGRDWGPAPAQSRLVGNRYRVLHALPGGGMSTVCLVLDRLAGKPVILKRLQASAEGRQGNLDRQGRAELSHEFRLLASLRHPHIISVLDYGFDAEGEPYFTMEWHDNGQAILDAANDRPLTLQVDYLVQALRALMYLHRHGVIHCDLKPENILVVRDQVKLLDFGLSTYRDLHSRTHGGTLAYMAPELIAGGRPTERGDLYALGLIAYQMWTGTFPFETGNGAALRDEILHKRVPASDDRIAPRLRPILARLLAKDPEQRPRTAEAVIGDLGGALDLVLSSETAATRESLLQAAPLVGRNEELATLSAALTATHSGRGATWFIAGESGVGKSRLLEEVCTLAQSQGMIVLRGQAVSQGGGPYHVWRDVVRHLILHAVPNDAQAAILKSLLPDIAEQLERSVPNPPLAASDAAQSRLLLVVEELFRQVGARTVVVLEDLHWSGTEGLRMLSWLARTAEELPLVFLASFRLDESPQLAESVACAKQITLRRLAPDDVRALCESVVGSHKDARKLVDLVQRESEGIPFFVVEVLRSLAESSGGLEQIQLESLPAHVSAGGMERVIRRRLQQVPASALAPLQIAAVAGRTIDPLVMGALFAGLDIERWADGCTAVAVLEVTGAQWRFSHDKFREQLVADLTAGERVRLHRCVAEAIERMYPGCKEYFGSLVHLWQQAGIDSNEAHYAQQAGLLALESNACREAIAYLKRALRILETNDPLSPSRGTHRRRALLNPNASIDISSPSFHRAAIEASLADAFFRLGDMAEARLHGERALALVGQPTPSTAVGWTVATTGEIFRRTLQSLWKSDLSEDADTRQVATTLGVVEHRLVECFFYALQPTAVAWSILRVINRCEVAGPSTWLAHGYLHLALGGTLLKLSKRARRWRERALLIAEQTQNPSTLGFAWSRISAIDVGICDWQDSLQALHRALALAEDVGDVRLIEECEAQLGGHYFFTAQYQDTMVAMRRAAALCSRTGNRQVMGWALMGWGDALVRLGRAGEALPKYEEVIRTLDDRNTIADTIWAHGMYALAQLRSGNQTQAFAAASRALSDLRITKPVGYWVQHGTAATCEVFLSLLEGGWVPHDGGLPLLKRYAAKALACLRQYGRRFPLGRAHVPIWSGLHAWLHGRVKSAHADWRRALRAAESLELPYERGRAHYEIGRHLDAADPGRRDHLQEALRVFVQLGCKVEREWAQQALHGQLGQLREHA